MNLQPLFETQKKLDERIVKEKGLEGVALLDKKILALQVELGELANEWRGFKFWSENQKPNTDVCDFCDGNKTAYAVNRELNISTPVKDCPVCRGSGKRDVNPLLEEYVDCLHFILSIGNVFGFESTKVMDIKSRDVVIDLFSMLFEIIPGVKSAIEYRFLTANGFHVANVNFQTLLNVFGKLGKELGFTWEQIEQAYYDKNKVNHERQANGY